MANPFASNRFGGGALSQGPGVGGGGQTQGQVTESQIVNTVKQDMDDIEKKGQWIFSCYSPAKDCASIPGLDDLSQEELRWEAYVAKTGNNIGEYTNRVKTLVDTYSKHRQQLKNPDQNMRQILVKIYNKETISAGTSAFGGGSSGGMFGASGNSQQSSAGIFGAPAAASSSGGIFGGGAANAGQTTGSGGLFGKPSGSGLFSSQPAATGNTFGQSSVFGGATAVASTAGGTSSIFGGGPTSTAPAGVFGAAATVSQSSSSSVFGGAPSNVFGGVASQPFGAAPANNSSLFGTGATPTPASSTSSGPFSTPQKPGEGLFGKPVASVAPSAGNAFATPQSSGSLFGAPPTTPAVSSVSVFSAPAAAVAPGPFSSTTSGSSLFGVGGGVGQPGGLFGKPAADTGSSQQRGEEDPSLYYTPLDQLSAEDKAAFEAAEFEFGKIPTVPPPRELCI